MVHVFHATFLSTSVNVMLHLLLYFDMTVLSSSVNVMLNLLFLSTSVDVVLLLLMR